MTDLLEKEKVGNKKPEPEPAPPKDGKALPEYWARETKTRFYRGGMRAAGIPLGKEISKKEFDKAVKEHYGRPQKG
jgi:hypothetical protein